MAKSSGPPTWNIRQDEQKDINIDLKIDAETVEAFTRANKKLIRAIAIKFSEYVKNCDAASLHLFSQSVLRMIGLTNEQIKSDLLEQERRGKNLQ